MTIHIWHEDSVNSSTDTFWKFLADQIGNKKYVFDIQGFNGNSNLLQVVMEESDNICTGMDLYLIVMDRVLDNTHARELHKEVKRIVAGFKNAFVSDIMCFEFIILSFGKLKEWTEPLHQPYADRFAETWRYIEIFKEKQSNWKDSTELVKYAHCRKPSSKNVSSEKIAAWLLSDLLNNLETDFKVTKTKMGKCWKCDCCVLREIAGESCRLKGLEYSGSTKASNLYRYTYIFEFLKRAKEKYEK